MRRTLSFFFYTRTGWPTHPPTHLFPMPQKGKLGDVPIEYDYARLTPDDIERIKADPRKEIYDYTFDHHEVLSADAIAARVRFVYLEARRMHGQSPTTTAADVETHVLESDPSLESFKTTHPRIFGIVCNPHASRVDLDAITHMLDLKRQQENGRDETSVLADVERMVIRSADEKRCQKEKGE